MLHSPILACGWRAQGSTAGHHGRSFDGGVWDLEESLPFMAVDAKINGSKGQVMAGQTAASLTRIRGLAQRAVQSDSLFDANVLLSAIRAVSLHTHAYHGGAPTDQLLELRGI